MATQKTLKLSDYYLKIKQGSDKSSKNVVTNSEGKITTEDKPTNATTEETIMVSCEEE